MRRRLRSGTGADPAGAAGSATRVSRHLCVAAGGPRERGWQPEAQAAPAAAPARLRGCCSDGATRPPAVAACTAGVQACTVCHTLTRRQTRRARVRPAVFRPARRTGTAPAALQTAAAPVGGEGAPPAAGGSDSNAAAAVATAAAGRACTLLPRSAPLVRLVACRRRRAATCVWHCAGGGRQQRGHRSCKCRRHTWRCCCRCRLCRCSNDPGRQRQQRSYRPWVARCHRLNRLHRLRTRRPQQRRLPHSGRRMHAQPHDLPRQVQPRSVWQHPPP